MAERLIVYVDGFNLYHGLHDKAGCRYLWLDLEALARAMRPRSQLVSVKYFTAYVDGQPEALSRQQAYLAALAAQSGGIVQTTLGRYQRKTMTCRSCGGSWVHREEKETDVNIAVQLVVDAANDEMDAALLVSADSDLVPAVKAVRRLRGDLFMAAAFPPERFSAELKNLMPASFSIGMAKVRGALLSEVVIATSGHEIRRPRKWDPQGSGAASGRLPRTRRGKGPEGGNHVR